MRGGGAWAEESAQFAECPDQGHLWSTTRQESRGPEGGARKQRGGRRLPGNKQQLEKGGGRARDSVAHHSEGEDERARALMRSSLNLKKGGKRGLLSQTVGIKDESGLRGAGCWACTRQTHPKGLYSSLSAAWITGMGKWKAKR